MYYNIKEDPNHIHHDNRKSKNNENWLKMNILKLKEYKPISRHIILK
jgi:hypothetical protein